jgi:metal-responsive CopG/Arc/MetJ family transcriptional regulator
MKHERITISIPQNIKRELYLYVKKRGISRFITEAVIEKLKERKLSLEEQYKLAAQDEELNREFKEWEDATIGDGLNDSNKW